MSEKRKRSNGEVAEYEAQRLAQIILHAAALETEERDRYLQEATGEDPALLAEVHRRLQSALKLESSFLAEPAGRLFATSVAENGSDTADPPSQQRVLTAGTLLGDRYRIVSFLGRGGMGEVYRADDLKLGEPVALKLLPSSLEQDAMRRSRLLEEARVARKITHQNVCRVHDVFEAEGLCYLSMEYIDGEDLASVLRRIGRLPKAKARQIGLEICAGLTAAHRLDILHRDLKPANVMLDGAGRIRITDFGLAGCEGSLELSGSPAYLAPERWNGATATVRSELYALGLMLYELFTGHPAVSAESVAALRRCHLESLPRPPSRRVEGFDPDLERLILHCLEKDPARRPATVEEVAGALEQIAPDGEPQSGLRFETLLACHLADSASPAADPGVDALHERHQRIHSRLCERHRGRGLETAEGTVTLFERPILALDFALDYHAEVEALSREVGVPLRGRVAIHVAEVESPGEEKNGGLLEDASVVRRLLSLAIDGQTLLTRSAFDLARRGSAGESSRDASSWLAHGAYLFEGADEPLEVFEVGVEGKAPLVAPEDSAEARRVVDAQTVFGWRPAPGVGIPGRPHWAVSEKIGEGGFGDVWLVAHRKTGERRVFKFCYQTGSLRSLKREITLFRLLKEELGERGDTTRILDWNFDQAPYYIESEYTAEGDLLEWAEGQGGIEQVPMAARLEILAQVADALAAAHSVGVLHKDVKPANVLISELRGSTPHARLTDFGIGLLVDRERLAGANFTVLGMTEATCGSSSSEAGTRLYLAPELMEGRAATVQADIYSLGVFLYQLVVGDLSRALAPGWRREVNDELLRQDIAEAVDGVPERRLRDARLLAERLRTLDQRRSALEAERRRALEVERTRRRWKLLAAAVTVLLLISGATGFHAQRTAREAERANREAEAARQVSQFMVDLFEVSFPSEARGNSVTAREILDRGAEKIRFDLSDQPITRARMMDTIGTVYFKLGLYDDASPLLEDALSTRRELFGDDHPDVAVSLASNAELAAQRFHFDEAESLFQRALEIHSQTRDPSHPAAVKTLGELAATYYLQGRYADAQAAFQQAIEITEETLGPQHPSVVGLLNRLARNHHDQGRYAEAEPLYWRALAVGQGAYGSDHPDVAATLTNLADLYREQGHRTAAEAYYRRSLAIKEKIYGPGHPELANTLNNYGQVFASQGRYVEAEALYLRARAITERAGDPRAGYAWYHLAELARRQGRYSEAERLFRQSLENGTDSLPAGHRLLAYPLLGLANTYRDQELYEEAEPLYEQVLATREGLLPPGHERLTETYDEYAAFLRVTGREAAAEELGRRRDAR